MIIKLIKRELLLSHLAAVTLGVKSEDIFWWHVCKSMYQNYPEAIKAVERYKLLSLILKDIEEQK